MQPPPPLPRDRPPDTPPPPPPHDSLQSRRNMSLNRNMNRSPRNPLRPDLQGYGSSIIYDFFYLQAEIRSSWSFYSFPSALQVYEFRTIQEEYQSSESPAKSSKSSFKPPSESSQHGPEKWLRPKHGRSVDQAQTKRWQINGWHATKT